jgi:hypothetical protein
MGVAGEDYIKNLEVEADYESSGYFSLEAKKALEKMQGFRLQNPAEYILQLVSCAVLRGATQLQIEVGGRDVRIGFDGEPFDRQEFEEIFGALQRPDVSPRTQAGIHLAIALLAMRGYNPDVLVVESQKSTQRNVLQLYEEEVWVETLTGPCVPGSNPITYIGLEHSPSFWNLCLPAAVAWRRPERALLRELAYACPIPIYLNGARLGLPRATESVLLEGPGVPPVWANQRQHLRRVRDLPFWGVALRATGGGRIVVVQGGICFEQFQVAPPPDLVLYLMGQGLRRDFSQRSLVQDEKLDELLDLGLKALA